MMSASSETLSIAEARELALRAFAKAGVPEADAEATVANLLASEMMGIGTHGLIRVADYIRRIEIGGVKAKPDVTVEKRAPALAIVRADNGMGTVAGTRALNEAIDTAKEFGIAYVGVSGSNHFGAMVPYAHEAATRGMAMVMGSNASVTMPPFGGAEPKIGNNPFCVSFPNPGAEHFILDMAMSVAARGKIRQAEKEGKPIPEGWAVTKDGRPTTDPKEALAGYLSPMAGHKGSGLSMAVDFLGGLLPGGAFFTGIRSWAENPELPSELGHFMIAIDAERLHGPGYRERVKAFLATITDTPPADPARPVLYPGLAEQRRMKAAEKEGVTLPASVLADIRALAEG